MIGSGHSVEPQYFPGNSIRARRRACPHRMGNTFPKRQFCISEGKIGCNGVFLCSPKPLFMGLLWALVNKEKIDCLSTIYEGAETKSVTHAVRTCRVSPCYGECQASGSCYFRLCHSFRGFSSERFLFGD